MELISTTRMSAGASVSLLVCSEVAVSLIKSSVKKWGCAPRIVCRAASSAETERLAAAKDLEVWLKQQGFPEQPVTLSAVGGMGLGCVAAQSLEAGDLAISIPEKYTITTVDVANHPVVSHAAAGKGDLIALTLWLMYEKSKKKDSPWYPYMRVLPEFTSSPLLWTAAEQEELLKGTATLDEVKQQLAALQSEYDALCTSLEMDSKGFPLETFTFENFKGAFSVVLSRAIYLPSADLCALVPFADMVNHNGSAGTLDYDDETQKVALKADKSHKHGDQVFASYAPKSPNSDLLIRYGFVDVEENENDYIEVETGLVNSDPLCGLKKEILQSVGLTAPQKFPVFLNRFPTQLLTYVRLARIQDAGLFVKINFEKDVIISPENEYEVLMLLMGDCRAKLMGYAGGTSEDEYRLLRSKKISHNERMAAMLRLKEKKILTEFMGALRNRLAPIRGIPTKSGLKDPNSDIKEMFQMVEEVASAPRKFFSRILEVRNPK